jgi:cytochrome P450
LDNIIYQEISDRRNGLDKNDLLGILMQIEDADDGSRMSDQQLRDEVVTLMVAGREAVANALSWTWLELARHPSAYGEFTQEIKTVLGGSMPTVDHLPRLTYTNKLITEILRLYPSTQDLVRRSTQDREVGDYWMPKGTLMFANAWIVHRHPQHFPDPEVFNPHRWDDDLERHLPPAVYSPFGYGPRTCIGKNFALLQIRLILATIAQQFRVELVPNQKIKLKFSSLTISPKNGVKVLLKRA